MATDFVENCLETAQRNSESKTSRSWTRDKLLGRSPYDTNEAQAAFPGLLAQIQNPALRAWRRLPPKGSATTSLAKIRQGPDEPYSDFVSRLTDAAERLVGEGETERAFIKHLAYENANPSCQETIRPHRCGNLSDYIKLCSGIGTSHAIGLAIGAALKDFTKDKQQKTCFNCKQPGHFARVNPRGLLPNEIRQMDVTHISEFGNLKKPKPFGIVGQGVFVCGGNMAYTALPTNWTGLCVQASILPDIDIIPGGEPVPLPSLDYITGRSKRAVQFIPLLIGLGISGAVATGTAGLGTALHTYNKLSNQLIDDVQALSGTINDLQDQIDSLAEVVLQNRRGLDLLTAEQGGICLALQERCCFYANKSGIVRDKIKKLQEDLVKRRRELFENPLWSGLNGLLPYLLPVLSPLISLLLILAFGPWAFRKLTDFVKQQVDSVLAKPIQVHYHRLAMLDRECDYNDC
ncbi:syncytin-B-like [Myotis daubentonii]|uniref:syncytin-B-like n=1 Tax=Myotis daubentonii TaxID=98922 RepID=UPI00287301B4|nr:syncytin-B-like [Myotis daubentonii]